MKTKKFSNKVVSVLCTFALVVALVFIRGDVPVVMAAEGDIAWNQLSTVFPDADVCQEIKDRLISAGLVEGAVVTQANLNNITNLSVDKTSGTINLQGVERLQGLETLSLDGDIQSLAPLNNLTKINYLSLDDVDNEISFSQMSNVSSITSIYFYNCYGIKSLDGLENNVGMKSVQVISCDDLTDISACSAYISLTYASFYSSSALEDISPLAGIQTMDTVNIGNTSVADISALRGKTGIKKLNMQSSSAFGENADTTCQVLNTLTGVDDLCLRGSDIDDTMFVQICNMTNLGLLDLLGNNITDLTPVRNLVNLTVLDIGDNGISDFTPLASLPNLSGYTCCNVGDKAQYIVASGPSRTIANPFKAMDGSVVIPDPSSEFTYNATDNTITFIGDRWQYSNKVATVQMNYNGRTFDMALYIRYADVVDPITITTQPEPVSVIEDEKILLSVEAESFDDNFRYQWYKDGARLNGEVEASLTIDKAELEDSGLYKCVVSNATASAVSNEVKVEVNEEGATTEEPTTEEPTTQEPTTQEPTTEEPTTQEPTTEEPTTQTTEAPGTSSTTSVAPEDNTTAAPSTTEAVNTDSSVTTGDTANPITAVMVLLLAVMGMILVLKAHSYKKQ